MMPGEPVKFHIPRLTRRRFLAGLGVSALGLGLYTWRVEPHWVEFVRRDLPVRNLPPALAGKTLAQVSDLHVGRGIDPDYLADSLRRLSDLKPDLVVITGDFTTNNGIPQLDDVARVLGRLTPPPLGYFAVTGNHDFGPAWSRPELAETLTARLTGMGIEVLRNASKVTGGLTVVGLDDFWGPNFRPADVLPTLDPDVPAVVLCHNPDAADRPVWAGYKGWILSGHTHGGQCRPPFLPPPLLPVVNRRYTAGEFDLGDGRRLYINRGLGHLLRVRFNVRPEITLFTLTRA
jgi:predicted MPP superfamily phosphohydrolase